KRGYRFVAVVTERPDRESADAGHERAPTTPVSQAPGRSFKRPRIVLLAMSILAGAGGLLVWQHTPNPEPVKSWRPELVVLPVQNLTGDAGRDYISDGMTEELITKLGSLDPDRLGVIARTSSMAYKQTAKTAAQIGGELGADYVLEGSLRGNTQR